MRTCLCRYTMFEIDYNESSFVRFNARTFAVQMAHLWNVRNQSKEHVLFCLNTFTLTFVIVYHWWCSTALWDVKSIEVTVLRCDFWHAPSSFCDSSQKTVSRWCLYLLCLMGNTSLSSSYSKPELIKLCQSLIQRHMKRTHDQDPPLCSYQLNSILKD